ncbi:MAG: MerR family transcriptional regulator [Lawsonibacter sp.]
MKINEVEAQVGITKKNIRFYEEQGLLTPRRNSANGYREYGNQEVETLQRIKLLRKLGVPLEEIRRMQAGGTVADGMRRHLVTLERERSNLEHAMELCQRLKDRQERLEDLDATSLLIDMERLEQEGTKFKDKQQGDTRTIRYVAPVVVTVLMTVLMAGILALMVWAYVQDPDHAPPVPLLVLLAAVPLGVIAGVLMALYQRIGEIQKGEADDAKDY